MNFNMVTVVYREKLIPLPPWGNLPKHPSVILRLKHTQLPYYDYLLKY